MHCKCSNADPRSDTHGHSYANSDGYIHPDTNSNLDTNCDSNPNGLCYTNRNADADRHAHGESYANSYCQRYSVNNAYGDS